MIVDSGVAAYSIFAPTDCHCMSEAGRRVSQSFLIEIHIQHCHPWFSQHFFSGIFRPFRNSQLSVWVTTMASMGQQVFDRGKYMEDDHTIVAMMDCAEQRYWPPPSQVGDTIYQSTAGLLYGHEVVLPKLPWLHDIGSIAYLFGHSWAHALKVVCCYVLCSRKRILLQV
jgi:hypothetical protein